MLTKFDTCLSRGLKSWNLNSNRFGLRSDRKGRGGGVSYIILSAQNWSNSGIIDCAGTTHDMGMQLTSFSLSDKCSPNNICLPKYFLFYLTFHNFIGFIYFLYILCPTNFEPSFNKRMLINQMWNWSSHLLIICLSLVIVKFSILPDL